MGVFRVEVSALNAAGAAQTILIEDGRGRSLESTDTPANAWVYGGLLQVPAMRRDMFSGGAVGGQSRRSFGVLSFANPDGLWDHLSQWAFDGRTCTVYYHRDDPTAAFPGSWTLVQSMTMRRCLVSMDTVEIEIRDGQEKLDQPIQSTLYAGDNVLPAGLEGVEDLEGKPKPLVFGSVRNIPLVEVNSAKVIYQASSEALNSVGGVYDRGILLSGGMTWTAETSGFGADAIQALVWADELDLWVAVGLSGKLSTSTDGESWTSRTSSFSASDIFGVAWNGSLFVAVGESGKIATSANGTSWTQRTTPDSGTWSAVAWSPELTLWVTVGASGRIASSPDGETWTSRTSDVGSVQLSGVAWGAEVGRWAVVGETGNATVSADGVTWDSGDIEGLDASETYNKVRYARGLFVAGHLSGSIAVSADGISWSERDEAFGGSPAGGGLGVQDLGYHEGRWVLAGGSGFLASSEDGNVYTRHFSGVALSLSAVAAGDGYWLAGGTSGTLLKSAVTGTYASEADLLDDDERPKPGTYKAYLAGGLVRLGSSPRGTPTADAVQGANAAARTVGQGAAWIWTRMGVSAGTDAGDYLSADVTALDSAVNDVVGWNRNAETNATELLNLLALSARAWWGVDRLGRYRIARVVDPAGASADATFGGTGIPMARDIRVLQAPLPIYRTVARYDRNYTVQGSDLAGGVSEARKALLRQAWLEVVDEDAAVRTRHPLSEERVLETALTVRADAVTRASDEMDLFDSQRRVLEVSVDFDATTLTLDLGNVINVVDTRLGLSSGVKGLVVHVDPDPDSERITFGLWMAA